LPLGPLTASCISHAAAASPCHTADQQLSPAPPARSTMKQRYDIDCHRLGCALSEDTNAGFTHW
jgi:hypothetical protein